MPDPDNPQAGGPDNSGDPQGTQSTSVVNADGSFVDNWSKNYSEEDRATLSRFTKFDDFVTSHMALRRKFNKDPEKLVEIPDESSSDEVREAFHRARGVPEKAEDYKYDRSPDLSENVETSDEHVARFSQIAKKYNLTQEQYNGVVNDYLADIDKDIASFELIQQDKEKKAFEDATAALKKDFGNAFEEKTARANMLLRKYEGQEMVAELGLENNPAMTRFLDNIAEDMSEDRIKGLTSSTSATPNEINAKINELKEHPAFLDREHAQHKDIVNQLSELYKKRSA